MNFLRLKDRIAIASNSSSSSSRNSPKAEFLGVFCPRPRFRMMVSGLLLVALTACVSPRYRTEAAHHDAAKSSNVRMAQTFRPETENAPDMRSKPYVVLVSIDGYRHDYNEMYLPPNLRKIAASGVSAKSLRPVYPSKTFTNHYALATGLYADKHGIVSNEFFDPERNQSFSLADRQAVQDGTWYKGEPLWLTVARQGLRTASFFWVGSDADIQGEHPNYFFTFDDKIPYAERVDQVLSWLRLPESQRPHLITLYFEGVDGAGHQTGFRSDDVKSAILTVDKEIGRLQEGLRATGLPVNLIIVSDHGMAEVKPQKSVVIDENPQVVAVLNKFKVVGRGPQIFLYLNPQEDQMMIDRARGVLGRHAQHYRVYRREEMRAQNFSSTKRVGDLVLDAEYPYVLRTKAQPPFKAGGNHGWDPMKNKDMHGVFMATGPAFVEGAMVETFGVVAVYPIVLRALGLKALQPIDGSLSGIEAIFREKR